jgi:hypothetical protein
MTWHQIAKAALEGQSVSSNPNGVPEKGYYRYGEYPRFLRPVGAHQPQVKLTWEKRDVQNL